VDCDDINICLGKVVNNPKSPVIQEKDDEEEEHEPKKQESSPVLQPSISETTNQHKSSGTVLVPPYPERLTIEKPSTQLEFDLLGELRNVCVKIMLFQAIKDVPIYAKVVRELCLRNPGRKKKDPLNVHVIGKLADLMLGKFFMTKYVDPGSPIVNVHINNISIPNTLIDLGSAINIMTKETMEILS
jgi:hypothetical protein